MGGSRRLAAGLFVLVAVLVGVAGYYFLVMPNAKIVFVELRQSSLERETSGAMQVEFTGSGELTILDVSVWVTIPDPRYGGDFAKLDVGPRSVPLVPLPRTVGFTLNAVMPTAPDRAISTLKAIIFSNRGTFTLYAQVVWRAFS